MEASQLSSHTAVTLVESFMTVAPAIATCMIVTSFVVLFVRSLCTSNMQELHAEAEQTQDASTVLDVPASHVLWVMSALACKEVV